MDKYSPHSIYENAFSVDRYGNEYVHEALYLAVILKAAGERTKDNEHEIAKIMHDINLEG